MVKKWLIKKFDNQIECNFYIAKRIYSLSQQGKSFGEKWFDLGNKNSWSEIKSRVWIRKRKNSKFEISKAFARELFSAKNCVDIER